MEDNSEIRFESCNFEGKTTILSSMMFLTTDPFFTETTIVEKTVSSPSPDVLFASCLFTETSILTLPPQSEIIFINCEFKKDSTILFSGGSVSFFGCTIHSPVKFLGDVDSLDCQRSSIQDLEWLPKINKKITICEDYPSLKTFNWDFFQLKNIEIEYCDNDTIHSPTDIVKITDILCTNPNFYITTNHPFLKQLSSFPKRKIGRDIIILLANKLQIPNDLIRLCYTEYL